MYVSEISEHDVPLLTKEYETKSGTKKYIAVDTKRLTRTDLTKIVLNMYDNTSKRQRLDEMKACREKLDKSTDAKDKARSKKVSNEISALGSDYQIKLNFVGYNKDWRGNDNNFFKFFKGRRGLIEAVNGAKQASNRYGSKFDLNFYNDAKDSFKTFIDNNMDKDTRGRDKLPEFYTAALIQSRDGARRSECAIALLVIKESKFIVIIKVGDMEFGITLPKVELASYTLDMREDENIKWRGKYENDMLDLDFDMEFDTDEMTDDEYESLLEAV
ncbi:TPA: hypothetical protein NKB25_000662 [Vibrio parahaemolyticus]|nr:hypothetical protein [Vibrio parahaemolyticus]